MSYVRGSRKVRGIVSNMHNLIASKAQPHDIPTITIDTTVRDVKAGDARELTSESTFLRAGLLLVVKSDGVAVLFDSSGSGEEAASENVVILYQDVDLQPLIDNGDSVVQARALRSASVYADAVYGDLAGLDQAAVAGRLEFVTIRPV